MSTTPKNGRAARWPSTAVIEWQRQQLAAAGIEMPVADEPLRFLRMPDVQARVGLSRSEIYRRVAAGTFPRPLALGVAAAVDNSK